LLRTADRGPPAVLPATVLRARSRPAGMTSQQKRSGTRDPEQEPRIVRQSDGWQILSYMLGGMILYGGIGWLVSHFTGIAILFPIGMILGIGLSVAMIIFRFTRS
jgi:ATP synthase protein I